MSTKKRGLGRGLDALLNASAPVLDEPAAVPVDHADTAKNSPVKHDADDLIRIPIEFVRRSRYQPRRVFDQNALQDLADSISAQGIMQPLVVRPMPGEENVYELIAGERRWRASQLAGLSEVPCILKHADDQAVLAMALIENIQREDLNPIEEAMALSRLQQEFSLTHEEVAEVVGKSRATVTNLLRLLNLAPAVREMLEERKIEMGHARAILGLAQDQQAPVANEIAKRGLSVREAEALVRKMLSGGTKSSAKKGKGQAQLDPDVQRLQDLMSENLGAPVHIEGGKGKSGRVVIRYASLDELDGILTRMGVSEAC